MEFNPNTEFIKHLKSAKKNNDHMALAWILTDFVEENKNISKKNFNAFRKYQITKQYGKLLKKSIKRFKEMIENDKKLIKSYGYFSAEGYVDKDYHNNSKRYLKNMEKEAKRIKLKLS